MSEGNSTQESGLRIKRDKYSQDFGGTLFRHVLAATSGVLSTDFKSISHIDKNITNLAVTSGQPMLIQAAASGNSFVKYHTVDKNGLNPTTSPTGTIMVFGQVRDDGTGPV